MIFYEVSLFSFFQLKLIFSFDSVSSNLDKFMVPLYKFKEGRSSSSLIFLPFIYKATLVILWLYIRDIFRNHHLTSQSSLF
jgi:hypothetical protein